MRRRKPGDISVSVAKLLTMLRYHGAAKLHATRWIIPQNGVGFQHKTIEAAYERCLVKIVLECGRRHQRRQTVELTDIGLAAARGIEWGDRVRPGPAGISEAASLMITEIVSDTVPGDVDCAETRKLTPSPTRLVA